MIIKNNHKLRAQLERALGPELFDFIHLCNVAVAGGAIRSLVCNTQVSDYDLYFAGPETLKAFQDRFAANKTFTSENADCYKINNQKVQAIKKAGYLSLPMDVLLDKFDFTVCQAAFFRDQFYFGEDFLLDNAARRIVYTGSEFPISSLVRVNKYLRKGYTISSEQLVKISMSIHSLKIESAEALKSQLMGIDILYLRDKLNGITDEAIGIKDGDDYQARKEKMADFLSKFNQDDEEMIEEDI